MLLLRKSGTISFDDILTVNGLRCITFQQACQEYGLLRDLPASVLERTNFDVVKEQAKVNSYAMQLNSEQRNVVDILLSAVYNNAADTLCTTMLQCYFLDGPAGTGKTFVYSTLLHTIRGRGDDVIPVASTGILALGCWTLERKKSGSKIQLPLQCYPSIQDSIHQLYSDIDFSSVTPQELKGRAILTVNNERSMEINNKVLEFMPGNETVYKAVDMIMSEDPQYQLTFPEEFLNSLTPTGLPPYELKLKLGCIIMLLRNLTPCKELCYGTRLVITKLQQNIIQAKSIDGTETFLIPRISLIPSQINMPFKFKRMQFPFRLAFSMTINKSQGQTFEKICLVLNEPFSVMDNSMLAYQEHNLLNLFL
ncbi:hypothetical protein AVEN_105284-1 [Araneus ventricosus]|uniref:ATP-dependent DNA helicase n=1 Tax=Araneus ventricosus TaxID=182803 RepID=A0A4Y2TB30_ARAVE|nr:hypothetical protein AVEN_105284-1 [Araneus ventricosus]